MLITPNLSDEQTTTPKHNKHWLSSRAALCKWFRDAQQIRVTKDEHNKPALQVDGTWYHLSITHSFEYAAVLFSTDHLVALDLEKIDARVTRVADKFLHEEEAAFISKLSETVLAQTITWSAKETLYKLYGKKELLFKRDLRVYPFSISATAFTFDGSVKKDAFSLHVPVHAEIFGDFVLTYAIV